MKMHVLLCYACRGLSTKKLPSSRLLTCNEKKVLWIELHLYKTMWCISVLELHVKLNFGKKCVYKKKVKVLHSSWRWLKIMWCLRLTPGKTQHRETTRQIRTPILWLFEHSSLVPRRHTASTCYAVRYQRYLFMAFRIFLKKTCRASNASTSFSSQSATTMFRYISQGVLDQWKFRDTG